MLKIAETPLPKNWSMHVTQTGTTYFSDHTSKKTQATDPRFDVPYPLHSPLTNGWAVKTDKEKGLVFFVNTVTNEKCRFDPRTDMAW